MGAAVDAAVSCMVKVKTKQCEALTKSGRPCINSVVRGTRACSHRSHQKQFASQESYDRFGGLLGSAKRTLVALFLVLSVLSTLLAFLAPLPRIEISAGQAIRRRDFFSVPFEIKNNGYLPLWEITFVCEIEGLRQGALFQGLAIQSRVSDRLAAGESQAASCSGWLQGGGRFGGAKFNAVAAYWTLPFRLIGLEPDVGSRLSGSSRQGFVAVEGDDGEIRLLPWVAASVGRESVTE